MNLVAVTSDGLTLRNAARLAAELDLDLVQTASLAEVADTEPPAAVLIDLEADDGLGVVSEAKDRWPQAMAIGLVTMPGNEVWKRAERAGCDLVTTRGALAKAASTKLTNWIREPGGRRLRLFALADVAGRLGVVDRIEDSAVGPLAVYHIGGEIRVAQDACPHAGARLSHGGVNVDDGVVTCPAHGSRFDVITGDRVRGPADDGLETYRVLVEDGQVFVQFPVLA